MRLSDIGEEVKRGLRRVSERSHGIARRETENENAERLLE